MWHEFAHRVHHQSDLLTLMGVAEIDGSVDQQDAAVELLYYAWYHKGQQVGPSVSCGPQMTADSLLATSMMMIDMEKKYTEE